MVARFKMKNPGHNRILVIRTDRIGDVVLATPLIRSLRQTFPQAYIAALVAPYAKDVLAGNPHLNEILVDAPTMNFWQQTALLRKHKFDTALLLHPTERLTWMIFAAGIRTRVTVGLRLNQVLTFMHTVSRKKYIEGRHEADYCLDLGRKIGVQTSDLATEVFLSEEERKSGRERVQSLGKRQVVCLHPGSGASAPNWRVERYVDLARILLQESDVGIVLTGSAQERIHGDAFKTLQSDRLINVMGELDLRGLMGVLSQASVVVSASTGPMHLAAALKVPTVSMFCPLPACAPSLWGPQGNRSAILLPHDNYCQGECPGDPHRCEFEGGITPKQVARAVQVMLGPF
ncbi:MAG: glycosyltransferase family 9 protein [Bacteroidota bacterium]